MVWERGCGAHCGGRNRGKTAAAVANNDEQNRRPGGVSGARVRGKRERAERALYGRDQGKQTPRKSLGLIPNGFGRFACAGG